MFNFLSIGVSSVQTLEDTALVNFHPSTEEVTTEETPETTEPVETEEKKD